MRKFLLAFLLCAAVLMPLSSMASAKKLKSYSSYSNGQLTIAAATEQLTMTNPVTAFYFPENDLGNYYIILSDSPDAKYDPNAGQVIMTDGFAIALDLYADPSAPVVLPSGTYTLEDTYEKFTCTTEYSIVDRYDADGNIMGNSGSIVSDVVVSDDGSGIYTITAEVEYAGTVYSMSYTGRLPFEDSSETPSVWPQIKQDMNIQATGAMAYYNGDQYDNNTGQMYVYLFDCAFDEETGEILEEGGFCMNLCLINKLFNDPKEANVMAGTYECARNLQRGTFYPGMEIEVSLFNVTIPYGTYISHNDSSLYNDSYGYGYMSEGTIVVEALDNGNFRITVTGKTNLGYSINGTFEGAIPVTDNSEGTSKPAHISTLEDDVDLDLSRHPMARVYNMGNNYGYQQFRVDIGSVSGLDGVYDGDVMRLEFICDNGAKYLTEGTYTLMEYDHNYTNMYAPGRMVQGYLWDGDMAGTFYEGFQPDRYLILQDLAPAISGTVGVTQLDDTNWRFDIDVYDDLNYRISGNWSGPLKLMYNPDKIEAGLDNITEDSGSVRVEYVTDNSLRVLNVDETSLVKIYSMMGTLIYSGTAAQEVDMSGFTPGVYVLNVNSYAIKIVKE